MSKFERIGDQLLFDGQPFRIFSGAMHYFRVHPELWRDRMVKMKAMGLNTLETYVAWNLHEPRPGEFNFSGFADIERFIETAGELGFKVIVRPGPYICAEWDFGGFPAWLSVIPGIRLRCVNKPYLDAVRRFFGELLPRIAKHTCESGGPVIAVQVENEYGSYGNDHKYLRILSDMTREFLPETFQLTSDGPRNLPFNGGTLPGVWATANFGSYAPVAFAKVRELRPNSPLMCCEFWNGWFDHWTEEHHTRSAEEGSEALRQILELDGHVNFYMAHGGTNFGFFNGANRPAVKNYQPTITSYDDDAPINESGDITEKFLQFRSLLTEFGAVPGELPLPAKKTAYGEVKLTRRAPLLENLDRLSVRHTSPQPLCMEQLGQNFGFIFYRTHLQGPVESAVLTVQEPRDRAQVFIDGKEAAVLYCNDEKHEIPVQIPPEGLLLEILVENLGRTNYGPFLEDSLKGITVGVRLDNQFQFDWEIYPLPLEDLDDLQYSAVETIEQTGPVFYQGEFTVDEPADTFLKVHGTKGVCWLNGFNLGRYWEVGPQDTLYIPAPLLKTGINRLEILELHHLKSPAAELTDTPVLARKF
jgi:beta-galactosidase